MCSVCAAYSWRPFHCDTDMKKVGVRTHTHTHTLEPGCHRNVPCVMCLEWLLNNLQYNYQIPEPVLTFEVLKLPYVER